MSVKAGLPGLGVCSRSIRISEQVGGALDLGGKVFQAVRGRIESAQIGAAATVFSFCRGLD